ncbi:MAG: biopolymer transporter TolR [Verrucomicrobiota bacterium]
MSVFLSAAASGAPAGRVGEFEGQTALGQPAPAGSAAWNAVSQLYVLPASGSPYFAWRKLRGDFILQAQLGDPGAARNAGWMIRRQLDPDADFAAGMVGMDGSAALSVRRKPGAGVETEPLPVTGADVLQLERRGHELIFSAARFGEPFVTRSLANIDLGDEVCAGLCAASGAPVEFRNVRIIRPAKPGFVPYKDYIGSRLEILDVDSGNREWIYSSGQPFEAPNWTPDGNFLIYNSSGGDENYKGRLYRFDLLTRTPALIPSGFAIRNNNDHVLSFDGSMLAISHHSAEHNGQSAVFTLPAGGGVPKRITSRAPSYLHGWSPDGKFLVYTGGRDGDYNIYRMASDGSGDEVALTHTKGLNDGPEYSPDGRHIYFNSTRTGLMQIWRMKPDGSEQEQVTSDGFNNWFAHLSPDGRRMVFLSYSRDVAPNDHPYYKHIYIRTMPVDGGTPKVIAYVYGGQGTMNVPSWSPDGRMVAFVSNSDGF